MQFVQIIIVTSFLLTSMRGQVVDDYVSDIGLTAKKLITKHGYPYQDYTIQTDDGYLLTLQRIPHGRQNKTVGHSVLIMPGLLEDSSVYVNMGLKRSLAFVLADNGYDVWLGNYRGSTLSRRHIVLNPDVDCKKYWDFSFHEIGYYDIPAFIDRILKVTNKENLYYIGHSQGTTSYLVMLSEKSQYAKKIRFASLLAPATILHHTSSPFTLFLKQYQYQLQDYSETHQAYEFTPLSKEFVKIGTTMCIRASPFRDVCGDIVLYIAGWTPKQLDTSRLPVILTNFPSGSSLKQVFHYVQLMDMESVFQNYDHGSVENLKRFGQESPPEYNITKVTPPAVIYYGDCDLLTVPKDVEFVANKLPSLFAKRLYKGFNHMDVIWGIDAPDTVFNDILKDMKFHCH